MKQKSKIYLGIVYLLLFAVNSVLSYIFTFKGCSLFGTVFASSFITLLLLMVVTFMINEIFGD